MLYFDLLPLQDFSVIIIPPVAFTGWVEGCCASSVCKQARSSKCNECCWDNW